MQCGICGCSGRPVGQAAVGLGSFDAGIEFPEKFSGGSVESEDFLGGSDAIESSVDDERIGLQAAWFFGVKGPGDLKFADVGAIDLIERRVMIIFGIPAVAWPVHCRRWRSILGAGGVRECQGGQRDQPETRADGRRRKANSRAQIFTRRRERMPSLIHRTGRSVPQAGREVRDSVARWESNSK